MRSHAPVLDLDLGTSRGWSRANRIEGSPTASRPDRSSTRLGIPGACLDSRCSAVLTEPPVEDEKPSAPWGLLDPTFRQSTSAPVLDRRARWCAPNSVLATTDLGSKRR